MRPPTRNTEIVFVHGFRAPKTKHRNRFLPPIFALSPPARILPADERLVLLTSAPRLLAREVSWLYELDALGTTLAEFERFERDAFGEERVCSFSAWSDLVGARRLLLLTTRAYAHPLATEHTLQRLNLSTALRLELTPRVGDPFRHPPPVFWRLAPPTDQRWPPHPPPGRCR